MAITQTVEIPADRRLVVEVPREVPPGMVVLTFSPVPTPELPTEQESWGTLPNPLPGGNYRTVEEALEAAAKKAADPNRKPISRLFGTHPGIFGGDGVAYQRAIRDEWD